jgi:hypothetical protein
MYPVVTGSSNLLQSKTLLPPSPSSKEKKLRTAKLSSCPMAGLGESKRRAIQAMTAAGKTVAGKATDMDRGAGGRRGAEEGVMGAGARGSSTTADPPGVMVAMAASIDPGKSMEAEAGPEAEGATVPTVGGHGVGTSVRANRIDRAQALGRGRRMATVYES